MNTSGVIISKELESWQGTKLTFMIWYDGSITFCCSEMQLWPNSISCLTPLGRGWGARSKLVPSSPRDLIVFYCFNIFFSFLNFNITWKCVFSFFFSLRKLNSTGSCTYYNGEQLLILSPAVELHGVLLVCQMRASSTLQRPGLLSSTDTNYKALVFQF